VVRARGAADVVAAVKCAHLLSPHYHGAEYNMFSLLILIVSYVISRKVCGAEGAAVGRQSRRPQHDVPL
jgi:hypothetical protein